MFGYLNQKNQRDKKNQINEINQKNRTDLNVKDYYKILGIDEEASEEEIRARWVELTKRYHPDLGKNESAEETLKEINDAYQILKDQSTRLEYDLERLVKRRSLRRAQRHSEKKTQTRKIILFAGISFSCILLGLAMVRWLGAPSSPPSHGIYPIERIPSQQKPAPIPSKKSDQGVSREEKIFRQDKAEVLPSPQPSRSEERFSQASALVERPARIPQPSPAIKETPIAQKIPPGKEVTEIKEPPDIEKVEETTPPTPQPEAQVPQKIHPPPETPTAQKDAPKGLVEVQTVLAEEKMEPVPLSPMSIGTPREKELKQAETPKKETLPRVAPFVQASAKIGERSPETIPEEKPRDLSKTPEQTRQQENLQFSKPKPEPVEASSLLLTLVAREEEVRQFFSNYIDQYARKNIDGFLSLFSSRAIQNQINGLEEIRKIYSTFFNQSQQLQYHLEWMNTRIQADRVEMEARYRVKQVLKKGGEEKIFKGKVRWVLVKEEGRLKIVTLNYQHEKSP